MLLAGSACGVPTPTPASTPAPLAREIILYNWAEYLPESVLETFTAETGIRVRYLAYETQEQAIASIRAGEVYDIVVLEKDLLPGAIQEGLLAPINYRNVPNFKNIAPNFRDLAYDPDNRHSIPFHWGTTGLLVRSDEVKTPIRRWADLWDPRWAGRVALWPLQRDLFAIALKSLGYSANSENPAQVEAALAQLLKLKSAAIFIDNTEASIVPVLESGQALIGVGWAYDALTAREADLPIRYVLPEEGSIIWGDHLVIPANSPRQREAELFLNFLLRPEISARIVNESYYPMANDAARPFILPDLLNDPIIYPPESALQDAEIIMPLSPQGQQLYDALWARFLAATS
jgi:spermidine/putrescine transport system substrate-binding protein